MTTSLPADDTHTLTCKHLPNLPPVVSEWQHSCQQPRCPHYCQGECCNPGRREASAPCPFDGRELLLEDAEPAHAADAPVEDSPSWATRGVAKKGQPSAHDGMRQASDPAQDSGEELPRHRHLGQLEDEVLRVRDDLRPERRRTCRRRYEQPLIIPTGPAGCS
jgi:hypothetical protein